MSIDLSQLTISKTRNHLLRGDFTVQELTESYLKNIAKKNSDINAYVEIFDDVLAQAEKADKEIATQKEKSSPLCGTPVAIKDNILIKGRHVSCGSKILKNYKATYDATAIAKLKEAGAVFLGRANMDEFAMGSSTERSAFGPTKNPHDTLRSPGGSSGGPAAVVAMDGALASLGSDTGGSVRQPASFCGVVGLKPTYGAVSRYGLVAMASSFDQIGPITKTVEDAEIVFNAISGKDPYDSTSAESITQNSKPKTSKFTIGIPSFLFGKETPLEDDVLQNFNNSIEMLKKEGHTVKEVEMPLVKYALPVYYIIMPAEASTNLARFDGVRYGLYAEGKNLFDDYADTRGVGFGPEVRRRLLLGAYVLSSGYYDAYYRKAVAVQNAIRFDCESAFKNVDVIVTPTSPTPAFVLGEKLEDPVAMYLSDILTVVANIGGFPAISVPSGTVMRGKSSLPLGIQFMAPHNEENVLFSIGKEFEIIKE
ncbi:MAG: Asp-tRNA(Asn)/Glu-tRNA(Gln) amidotransferase subunit GatA [Parcubacteria group bacterium]|nr:Asp-tRNA(Asn)/Glu-tRNA(Gln) amidotransferase subunit GatA [Parcubacteria group bacterium]